MEHQTVEDYIERFEGKTKEHLKKLKSLILKASPDAEQLFNYNIPAFALLKGGKREEQILMAGYKKHVGLYPHPTTMEHFWNQLDGYKKAKGSVQFPIDKPLPERLIIEMVRYRKKLLANKNQ